MRVKFSKIRISRKEISSLITSIYLFLLTVMFSGSAFQSIYPSSIFTILVFGTGMLLMISEFVKMTRNPLGIGEIFLLLFLGMFLFSSFIYPKDLNFNVMRICFVIIAYHIATSYPTTSIIKQLIRFSVCVAVAAIIGTFLLQHTDILSMLPSKVNINGVEYRFGLIYNYISIVPQRVCGFFWEPGLLATCMVYAIVACGCFSGPLRVKNIFILIILFYCGILTTSSAGYVLSTLSFFAILVRNKKDDKYKGFKGFIKFTIFVVLVICLLNLDYIISSTSLSQSVYFEKLLSDNMSQSVRAHAIMNNIFQFLKNPIGGIGPSGAYAAGKAFVGDTSTSTFMLAAYGIMGLSYTVAIIYGVVRQKNLNVFVKTIVGAIILSIVNKEPHIGNMFTWILIFLLLKKEHISEFKLDVKGDFHKNEPMGEM